ncbi:hypothetical protein AB9P05_24095 [Roseivirga sp. BDSF3-8]|uniref:hypothetical protein n=1 Tax=Roseivirga sp. BDSF3-8 TaxID=3241598 RepID=UPI0035322332
MKKEKLTLDSLQISSFKTSEAGRAKGGNFATRYPQLCDSELRCETIDYTACDGGYQCQKYP